MGSLDKAGFEELGLAGLVIQSLSFLNSTEAGGSSPVYKAFGELEEVDLLPGSLFHCPCLGGRVLPVSNPLSLPLHPREEGTYTMVETLSMVLNVK